MQLSLIVSKWINKLEVRYLYTTEIEALMAEKKGTTSETICGTLPDLLRVRKVVQTAQDKEDFKVIAIIKSYQRADLISAVLCSVITLIWIQNLWYGHKKIYKRE